MRLPLCSSFPDPRFLKSFNFPGHLQAPPLPLIRPLLAKGSAAAGPALHLAPPINGWHPRGARLSLTPPTSGMRRHRPCPTWPHPCSGRVGPAHSPPCGRPVGGLRRCIPQARPLHPTQISRREGRTEAAGLAEGRTRGHASGRGSLETSREGRGPARRPLRTRWAQAGPVLDGARGCVLRLPRVRGRARGRRAATPRSES